MSKGQAVLSHEVCPLVPSDGMIEAGTSCNIPFAYADIGLEKDEFAILVFFVMKAHNPADPNGTWYGYRSLQKRFKISAKTVRRVTFVLNYSGLVKIVKNKKDPKSGKCRKTHSYYYRHVNPEDVQLYAQILDMARSKFDEVYNSDGTSVHEKGRKPRR
jgi:hypothetical protein